MKYRPWLILSELLAMMALVLFGGLRLSKWLDETYKADIDKNGLIIKAVITGKKDYRVKTVYFRYIYKGKPFKNEGNPGEFYSYLSEGDTVEIKIDTLNPKDSYITRAVCCYP